MTKNKTYTIYKHTFPNGKVYIGQTFRNVEARWSNGNGYYSQELMNKAINKYGWDNIKHEILYENLTKEEADCKEKELIKYYNSSNREYGYNIALGGNSSDSISESTRKKMREHHADISGENNPMYNKRHKPETIKRMSEIKKGKVYSLETRRKMSESSKGFKHTKESREKISKAQLGELNHMYGKTGKLNHSSKSVYQIDINTNKIVKEYGSMCEAERELGISHTSISACCRGIMKQAGGYKWTYVSDCNWRAA